MSGEMVKYLLSASFYSFQAVRMLTLIYGSPPYDEVPLALYNSVADSPGISASNLLQTIIETPNVVA
jgi:hypothetical protein